MRKENYTVSNSQVKPKGEILRKIIVLLLALSLAAGGAAAYMISPFAGIIMSISRYTGASASQVGLGWNWKFSLVFFVFGVLFSLAWGLAFGG
jgi:inner membrane protein involved in colicin E2 resistance